ncbi:MAG TPA: hypothetical protein VF070_45370 [Streptosporangiaceae bacterium]
MRTIEDRIRAATRAAGETVPPDSVPPLRLPPQMLNGRSHGRSPYWTRWSRRLAPAAAAAAVIAVALTVTIVRLLAHGGETSGSKGSPASEVPRYYVAIAANGNPASVPTHAVVRETMSGALLATIMPSVAGDAIFAVTAAADDQTFVLDEQKWVPRTSGDNQASQTRLFYLLRLSSSGRPSSLTRLPITAGRLVTGVALSPDGTRLAIAVQPDTGPANLTEVRIYTLATGAVRTWSGIGTIGTGEDDAVSISWTADARTLAFDWYPDKQSDAGVRLLDVTRAGSDLLASSRRVVPLVVPPPSGLTCQTDAVITADGSTVVCGAIRYPPRFGQDSTAGFLEYSTATGKLVRTIHSQRSKAPIIGLMWSNPSGSVLIGAVAGGRSGTGQVGIITGSTFTPLPVPGALNPALAGVW